MKSFKWNQGQKHAEIDTEWDSSFGLKCRSKCLDEEDIFQQGSVDIRDSKSNWPVLIFPGHIDDYIISKEYYLIHEVSEMHFL